MPNSDSAADTPKNTILGIYGGTFDPIHLGHILPVEKAAKIIGIERVHLIPCHIPPHRQMPAVTAEHRLAMVKLACEAHPLFMADDYELKRQQTSYSIDTLRAFRAQYPNSSLVFFMGYDAFNGIQSWHQWQQLLDYCHIVVCARPGYELDKNTTLTQWTHQHVTLDIATLQQQLSGCIYFVQSDKVDISSTQLRQQLGQQRSQIALLDPKVAEYIQNHELYRHSDYS
ncbi:nicotinate-nucleotide adenylyltransferase [Alteromonadaceae bacterium BrNp21-10]|nr:nicotinate-nucleotide adenylyltransferase [Alteromonadaceae bacterium BrNp21-10]